MKRRDLFGYSLIVLADPAVAQTLRPQPPPPGGKPDFERIAPSGPPKNRSQAEPHMRLVDLETDVLVAGGGLAGICAAISAARQGARVVLLQDRSRLGGNSSSEVKMHVVGANQHTGRPGWREGGLIEELRLADAVNNHQRCWELWDLLLYDKVVSEPNITLLLETVLYSAAVKNGRIQEVSARCDKSEHIYRIKAKIFCDCTGDSRLGLEAGAEMRSGRESRAEFGESLAPEKADNETLGSSILFTSRLYRAAMPFTPPKWARKVTGDQLLHRKINSWEYGYWWIEWGGDKDILRDNERIRFELLSIVMGVWDYIKNSGEFPDSKYWAMDWVGMMPGKRGGRRLVGDHILTQHDLMKGRFEDAVAIGGWPMDDHPPGGFDRPDLPPNTTLKPPEVYDIPLRSLYSRNIGNLMMAGRNISASHVAFTSARVMATCAVIGQAVGTAAAQCVERGMLPKDLARDPRQLTRLQQTLLRDDQTLKARANQDPRDLARQAAVTASAEAGSARAALVLDGFLRDIPDKKGDPAEIHHWAAPLPDGKPAWIELRWPKPQRLRQIQITFDSGFKRQLTLTSSDSQNANIVRAPQPETVRDYRVLSLSPDGRRRELAAVKGNFQRLNRHRFEPVETQAVRIEIEATNGIDQARIFEIRCYA
ncbi:MAG TPA: FAD-dependent oxidoreductase [Bryobacteraceae bacterium]|nr:FAD-dependent oxidoreductase [Bryobacteraceae bacterium]